MRLYSPAFMRQSSVLACNLLLSCFHMMNNTHLQVGTTGSILGNFSLDNGNVSPLHVGTTLSLSFVQ